MSTKPEGEIAGFVSGRAERRKSERHAFVRFGQVLWLRKNGEAVTHGKRQTIMVRNYSEHGVVCRGFSHRESHRRWVRILFSANLQCQPKE